MQIGKGRGARYTLRWTHFTRLTEERSAINSVAQTSPKRRLSFETRPPHRLRT
jgi:hypothetical protein